jgi:hypothetical protein
MHHDDVDDELVIVVNTSDCTVKYIRCDFQKKIACCGVYIIHGEWMESDNGISFQTRTKQREYF